MHILSEYPILLPMAITATLASKRFLIVTAAALGALSLSVELASETRRADKIQRVFKALSVSFYAASSMHIATIPFSGDIQRLGFALRTKEKSSLNSVTHWVSVCVLIVRLATELIHRLETSIRIVCRSGIGYSGLADHTAQKRAMRIAQASSFYGRWGPLLKRSWVYALLLCPSETVIFSSLSKKTTPHFVFWTDKELAALLIKKRETSNHASSSYMKKLKRSFGRERLQRILNVEREVYEEDGSDAAYMEIAGLHLYPNNIYPDLRSSDWKAFLDRLTDLGLHTKRDLENVGIFNLSPTSSPTPQAVVIRRLQEFIRRSHFLATAERALAVAIHVLHGLGRLLLIGAQLYLCPRIFTAGFVYGLVTAHTKYALSRLKELSSLFPFRSIYNLSTLLKELDLRSSAFVNSLPDSWSPLSEFLSLFWVTPFCASVVAFNHIEPGFTPLLTPFPMLFSSATAQSELRVLMLYGEATAQLLEPSSSYNEHLAQYDACSAFLQSFLLGNQEGEAIYRIFNA